MFFAYLLFPTCILVFRNHVFFLKKTSIFFFFKTSYLFYFTVFLNHRSEFSSCVLERGLGRP